MKRLIALSLLALLLLAGCGAEDAQTPETAPPSPEATEPASAPNAQGDETAMDILAEIINDGEALEDAQIYLAEGKAYVNGIQVPLSEDETVDYQVNGVSSLYKTSSGWGYNVHKTTSADNLSFEEARLGFFETITSVRGHVTTIYGDSETGLVNKVDTQSYDAVRVTEVIDYNESMTIVRGDFELETQRVRPDVDMIVFHDSKFDDSIQIGDIALYFYGPEKWEIFKATPVVGTLAKNEDGQFNVNNGEYVHIESNVSRYNLIDCNRPSQFFNAYNRLGLQELEVVTWCTPTGHPIGFTYGTKTAAKESLGIAIENAIAAKDGVIVSEDGTGVSTGVRWVAQEDLDAYNEAIAAAQAAYNKNSTAVQEFDNAIYKLALALGEGGEKPEGFIGALGEGT